MNIFIRHYSIKMATQQIVDFLSKITTNFSDEMLSNSILHTTYFSTSNGIKQHYYNPEIETLENIPYIRISETPLSSIYYIYEYENPVYTLVHMKDIDVDAIRKLLTIDNIKRQISPTELLHYITQNKYHTKELLEIVSDLYMDIYESKEYKQLLEKLDTFRNKDNILRHDYQNFLTDREQRLHTNTRDRIQTYIGYYFSHIVYTKQPYSYPLENCLVLLDLWLNRIDGKLEEVYKHIQKTPKLKGVIDRNLQIYLLTILNFPLTVFNKIPSDIHGQIDYKFSALELLKIYSLNHKTTDIKVLNKMFNIDFNKLLEEVSPDKERDFFKKPYGRITLEYLGDTIQITTDDKTTDKDVYVHLQPKIKPGKEEKYIQIVDIDRKTIEKLKTDDIAKLADYNDIYFSYHGRRDKAYLVDHVVKELQRLRDTYGDNLMIKVNELPLKPVVRLEDLQNTRSVDDVKSDKKKAETKQVDTKDVDDLKSTRKVETKHVEPHVMKRNVDNSITRDKLKSMTVKDLIELCRQKGIKRYSGLRKDELVEHIYEWFTTE